MVFQPKSEIRTIFPPKIRWSPKKKKKVFTEIECGFSAEIGNSNDFSAQNQVVSKKKKKKKKKGLYRNLVWFFNRNRKFERFFRPKSGDLQKKKKKKKVFTKIESGFSAETVSFTVTLLFNYCYVRNYWKKTTTKHRQAMLS